MKIFKKWIIPIILMMIADYCLGFKEYFGISTLMVALWIVWED